MPTPETPANTPANTVAWHLRDLMAAAGMFKTTDLVEPLRKAGVQLSREQVFRLVTKPPARLNMEVLAALCLVLDCTPNDLIKIVPADVGFRKTGTANAAASTGSSIGSLRPVPARIHRPSNPGPGS